MVLFSFEGISVLLASWQVGPLREIIFFKLVELKNKRLGFLMDLLTLSLGLAG